MLLAVSKVPSTTGEAQNQVVFFCSKNWTLEERVQGMGFDTTSSILLELLLNHELLHIVYCHYILELIDRAVFFQAMISSSTLDVLSIVQASEINWCNID